jgi:hypothetical protein
MPLSDGTAMFMHAMATAPARAGKQLNVGARRGRLRPAT